jgi:hypothetical protein
MTSKSILTATAAALAIAAASLSSTDAFAGGYNIDNLRSRAESAYSSYQNGNYSVQYGNRRVVVGNGSSDEAKCYGARGYSVCVADDDDDDDDDEEAVSC